MRPIIERSHTNGNSVLVAVRYLPFNLCSCVFGYTLCVTGLLGNSDQRFHIYMFTGRAPLHPDGNEQSHLLAYEKSKTHHKHHIGWRNWCARGRVRPFQTIRGTARSLVAAVRRAQQRQSESIVIVRRRRQRRRRRLPASLSTVPTNSRYINATAARTHCEFSAFPLFRIVCHA